MVRAKQKILQLRTELIKALWWTNNAVTAVLPKKKKKPKQAISHLN